MEPNTCLNCGQSFSDEQKFCSHCGQRRDIKRFTFRQLIYDFLQTIVNTEKGVLRLLKGLATNPGQTAADYVEGKRKTYFNPFTFYALCIAFMVFIDSWLKPYIEVKDYGTMNTMPFGINAERLAGLQDFFNKHLNLVSVLATPYFAFGLWLFFRKRKRNAAEITVAFVLFAAFSSLLSTLFISPWLSAYRDTGAYYPILIAGNILVALYCAWGLKIFFGFRSAGGYIKVLAVYSLIGLMGFILLMLGIVIYASLG